MHAICSALNRLKQRKEIPVLYQVPLSSRTLVQLGKHEPVEIGGQVDITSSRQLRDLITGGERVGVWPEIDVGMLANALEDIAIIFAHASAAVVRP